MDAFDELISDLAMAKLKNHTNHNQNRKDHKNGIKKVQWPTKINVHLACPHYRKQIKNSRAARGKDQWAKRRVAKAERIAAAHAAIQG
ncbi:MAG: hypothetical protein KVP17_004958 [Porospora cf. gigantea B]|uniref:uncharacterized protein n=2 Tax=Porospora cf. gigantea B TaxID=2853592 RepID=UPI00357186A7|nr:MAG: hypothetical protein KVP17_004958 [Porospora cf. gigantea B]